MINTWIYDIINTLIYDIIWTPGQLHVTAGTSGRPTNGIEYTTNSTNTTNTTNNSI